MLIFLDPHYIALRHIAYFFFQINCIIVILSKVLYLFLPYPFLFFLDPMIVIKSSVHILFLLVLTNNRHFILSPRMWIQQDCVCSFINFGTAHLLIQFTLLQLSNPLYFLFAFESITYQSIFYFLLSLLIFRLSWKYIITLIRFWLISC